MNRLPAMSCPRSRTRLAVLAGVAGLCMMSSAFANDSTAPAADQAVAKPTLQLAERMIASCLEHAAATRLPPLSVVVVDASGALIAAQRQDGAMPASVDAALLKARTVIRTNVATAALTPALADPATRDAFLVLQLTGIAGGVPFAQGAVGVSGAQPDQDAGCAQQAVAATAGQ